MIGITAWPLPGAEYSADSDAVARESPAAGIREVLQPSPLPPFQPPHPFLFWFLLDRLAQSGGADFFHHHEYDPGYAQWRGDADRLARDNAELRTKLDSLEARASAPIATSR